MKMSAASTNSPVVFESTDVTALVGIQLFYLNKFIERKQYGITASVLAGHGRGKRRIFNEDDVFGIALVWSLFEAGLRSGAIQYALNQICGGALDSGADKAARIAREHQRAYLLIEREPRRIQNSEAKYPKQRVYFLDEPNAPRFLKDEGTSSVLVIPVGKRFSMLLDAISKMSAKREA